MRRISIALLLVLVAGLVAACSKSEPTPPAASTETAAAATGPAKADAGAADPGAEANQPRRAIEPAVGPDGTPLVKVDEAKTAEPVPPARSEAAGIAAAAQLTPGPAVDLGHGPATAEALAYMPDNTAGVFVVGSPQRLLDAVGFDALKAAAGERMKAASEELVAATGHDLLDPAVWGELGIDLSGPAGVAGLAAESEPYILFMTIGDRAKLDAALAAAAAKGEKTFDHEKLGDAELLSVAGYDRNVIVLRGKTVLVAGVDAEAGARELGRKVATQEAATSLVQAVEFTTAVKPLDGRDDALVWGNLGLGVRMSLMMERGGHAEAQKAMVDKVLGGMSGFAMGATVKDRAIELSAFLPLAGDALLRRIIQNFDSLPAALAAETDAPLLAVAMRIDPKAVLEFVQLSLASQGESLDEVRAAAKEIGGVDLDKDVFGIFDGRFSLVVTGDVPDMTADDYDRKSFGGAVVVGLANPEALKHLMQIASKLDGIPKNIKIGENGTMDLPLPTGQLLHIEIVGNALVASTDAGFAKRVAAGDASASFVAKLDHPDLKALVSRPNQAAWFFLPQKVLGLWFGARSSAPEARPRHPADDTKRSPERAAKEKELEALRAKVRTAERAQEQEQMAAANALFDRLGTLAETVEITDGGLRLRAGEYLGGTVAELAQAVMKMGQTKRAARGESDTLHDQLFKLENEVRTLELNDDMATEPK